MFHIQDNAGAAIFLFSYPPSPIPRKRSPPPGFNQDANLKQVEGEGKGRTGEGERERSQVFFYFPWLKYLMPSRPRSALCLLCNECEVVNIQHSTYLEAKISKKMDHSNKLGP